MSALPPIHGHEDIRARLARAAARRALSGSLLLHGRHGIGKQRLALWLARRLLCTGPDATATEPCGACRSCRLALRLEHPDIHWFFPMPRPRAGGSLDKLVDAVEDARAETLASRRRNPLRPPPLPGEPVGLYLAHVHAIRRIVAARPVMSDRQVVIVGNAELLVPQESSPEAANAFLKLLEEPPDHTTFLLTAGDPDALLPTLRSRLQRIRLRPLTPHRVADFLVRSRNVDADRARLVARLAQGAIGRALAFLPIDPDDDDDDDAEPGPLEALRTDARSLLSAATADRPTARLHASLAQRPTGARGHFYELLGFLTIWIRDLAAVACTDDHDHVINIDALDFLTDIARRLPHTADGAARAIDAVEQARALARGNVNPQLTLAWLLRRIHSVLQGTATAFDPSGPTPAPSP
ncbi:MAG: ATP-binding protein [Gemmatimonadota bacterium]